MLTSRREITLGATNDSFPEGTHMCLIYDDDEQRKKVISKFLADGTTAGEQVGYFVDSTSREEVRGWLSDMDVRLPDEDQGGDFELFRAVDVYCPEGMFVPEDMLERLRDCYGRALGADYTGARVSGEMTWALRGIPGSERLVEYEALINELSEVHPVTPICQYDARSFDGATLLNVLKVHPMMIVQGQIVRNPYYMKPGEFLATFEPETVSSGRPA